MIKRKVFYGSIYSEDVKKSFDKEVDAFIEEISKEECVIIHYNTFSYSPQVDNGFHSIRTEIIFKEIPTRKVLTEKKK
jgi:hypothetical protein